MVALNFQLSIFNYQFAAGLSLQLPAWRVIVAATVARAASAGCFGFLGHDVGCNVLRFLSLLVQGKLLAEGLARRPALGIPKGDACYQRDARRGKPT